MKRTSTRAAALTVAVAGVLVGAATAFAVTVQDEPRTADDHYSAEMTDEEVSEASKGTPGEIAPPCPDASVVDELKAQGLPVGPCDPVPESGDPVLIPESAEQEDAAPTGDVCPGTFIRSLTPGGPNEVQGPCGPGAEIIDVQPFTDAKGRGCATVTFVAATGTPAKTSSVCQGDKADPSKPQILKDVK